MAAEERYKCPDCRKFLPRTQFRDHPAECSETVNFNISYFVESVHGEQSECRETQLDEQQSSKTADSLHSSNAEQEEIHFFLSKQTEDTKEYLNSYSLMKPASKSSKLVVGIKYQSIRREGNEFICIICGTRHETRIQAKLHTESKHRIFPCKECGQNMPWNCENCSKHLNRVCYICSRIFKDSSHLQPHLKTHNIAYKSEIKISSTEETPPTKNVRKTKIVTMKPMKTQPFGKVKKKKENLYRDTLKVQGQFFECTKCESTHETRNQFQSHVNENHRDSPCTECGQKFPWKCENCVQHTKRACNICSKIFSVESRLRSHLNNHIEHKIRNHPYRNILKREGNLFKCTLCESTHKTRRKFQTHVNKHHRDFTCQECDQKFPWKCEKCSQHSERACYICPKIFNDSNYLNVHISIHLGQTIRPACKECGKEFSKQYLRCVSHKMWKSNADIPCEKGCGFTTRYKQVLKQHYLSPRCSPNNPLLRIFFCCFCESSFTTKKYKKRHERFHTEPKPHRCKICGVMFTESWNLKKHIKRIHALTPDEHIV